MLYARCHSLIQMTSKITVEVRCKEKRCAINFSSSSQKIVITRFIVFILIRSTSTLNQIRTNVHGKGTSVARRSFDTGTGLRD